MKIVICGGPGAGKTSLAEELSTQLVLPVLHTDDLTSLPWSDQSLVASRWLDRPEDCIIEGTTIVRGLRKWLQRHPTGLPAARIYWVERVLEKLEDGAERMRKGCRTVWEEIQPELIARGADVRVIY